MSLVHFKIPVEKSMYTINDPITKAVVMELVGVTMPVPNTDIVYEKDEKGNTTQREIRFIHGADTIYVEEQIKKGFPRDRKKSALDYITFIKGHYYFDGDKEKQKLEYLNKCNYNLSNPNRDSDRVGHFVLVDKKKETQQQFNDDLIHYQATALIINSFDSDKVRLRRLGSVLLGGVDSFEDEEIRNGLMTIAKKDPSRVLTANKSLGADTDDLVADAVKFGLIQILPTKVIWKGDETSIVSYRAGGAGKDKLIEFLSKAENSDTLNLLKDRVKEVRLQEAQKQVIA